MDLSCNRKAEIMVGDKPPNQMVLQTPQEGPWIPASLSQSLQGLWAFWKASLRSWEQVGGEQGTHGRSVPACFWGSSGINRADLSGIFAYSFQETDEFPGCVRNPGFPKVNFQQSDTL
jgi:hypothetical protein